MQGRLSQQPEAPLIAARQPRPAPGVDVNGDMSTLTAIVTAIPAPQPGVLSSRQGLQKLTVAARTRGSPPVNGCAAAPVLTLSTGDCDSGSLTVRA